MFKFHLCLNCLFVHECDYFKEYNKKKMNALELLSGRPEKLFKFVWRNINVSTTNKNKGHHIFVNRRLVGKYITNKFKI